MKFKNPTAATSVAFELTRLDVSQTKRLEQKVTIRHKVQLHCYFIVKTNYTMRIYQSRSQPGRSCSECQLTKLKDPENSKTSVFISAGKAVKLAFQQSRPAAAISHSAAERESSTARLSESPPPYVTRTRTCPQATQDGGQVARD